MHDMTQQMMGWGWIGMVLGVVLLVALIVLVVALIKRVDERPPRP